MKEKISLAPFDLVIDNKLKKVGVILSLMNGYLI